MHQHHTTRPQIYGPAGVSRDVPVYSPAFTGYSSSLHTEGGLRLSRPVCLVLRRGGLPVQRRSPTHALTGPSVEYIYVDQVQRVTTTLNRQPWSMETAHTQVMTVLWRLKGFWYSLMTQQATAADACLALYRCPPSLEFEQVCLPLEFK